MNLNFLLVGVFTNVKEMFLSCGVSLRFRNFYSDLARNILVISFPLLDGRRVGERHVLVPADPGHGGVHDHVYLKSEKIN